MKRVEIESYAYLKYGIYLENSKVESTQEWLLNREEVLHIHPGKGLIMFDLTPRCEQKDIKQFFEELDKKLKGE